MNGSTDKSIALKIEKHNTTCKIEINKINKTKEEMHKAHAFQTKLITEEASGNSVEVNVLLIHAQDHFMIAMEVITMVERMIKLYKIIFKEIDEKNNKLLSM